MGDREHTSKSCCLAIEIKLMISFFKLYLHLCLTRNPLSLHEKHYTLVFGHKARLERLILIENLCQQNGVPLKEVWRA